MEDQNFDVAPGSKGLEVGNWRVYAAKIMAGLLVTISGVVLTETFNYFTEVLRGSGMSIVVKDAMIALLGAGSVAAKRYLFPTNPSVIKVKE